MHIRVDTKSFGTDVLFQGFDLQVPDGQFVAIAGASGCGKTTLLRMIAGLEAADGLVCQRPPAVGFVFQEPRLLPWRSVADNLALAASAAGQPASSCVAVLAAVGLPDAGNLFPGALSLGMKRRVELARALLVRPKWLILDEPFVSLDDRAADEMRRVLHDVLTDLSATVLMVTHDLDDGLRLADRIIFLAGRPVRIVRDLALTAAPDQRNADWLAGQRAALP